MNEPKKTLIIEVNGGYIVEDGNGKPVQISPNFGSLIRALKKRHGICERHNCERKDNEEHEHFD